MQLQREEKLNNAVRQFWEIEHGVRKNKMTQEERKCEKCFETTER